MSSPLTRLTLFVCTAPRPSHTGWLLCTAYIAIEVKWRALEGHHKAIYVVQVLLCAVWCVLWAVAFCAMLAGWMDTTEVEKDLAGRTEGGCAIALSFFSALTWGMTSFLLQVLVGTLQTKYAFTHPEVAALPTGSCARCARSERASSFVVPPPQI